MYIEPVFKSETQAVIANGGLDILFPGLKSHAKKRFLIFFPNSDVIYEC